MTAVLPMEIQKPRSFLQKWVYGALKQRLLAALALVIIIGLGINTLSRFPIDGLPDISNVQVQVITEAPALGPQEVEQFITFPLEIALTGLPRATQLRSISKYGLSQITIVFEDGTNIYSARALVNEKLVEASRSLPAGSEQPVLGPVSTGLGEIYIFQLKGEKKTPMELRTLMDWTVIPRLKSVRGVAEINPMGGFVKQYQVKLDPERLLGYNITPEKVFSALEANNANSGGGYASDNSGEQTVIRGAGLIITTQDVENVIVARANGSPVYVRDVAEVTIGHQLRQGVVTRDGKDGIVLATVLMRSGENANGVVADVKQRVTEIQKELPEGVEIEALYDRTSLIKAAIQTVSLNLFEGALLVTAILLLMLGNIRGALITAFVIPLSMLLALTGMLIGGVSGNLMSLGAIDFGLLVDGAVFMVENIIAKLAHEQPQTSKERMQIIAKASAEVAKPVAFAITIITVVYIPIFGLSGVEGKLFQPMAFTVILALIASLMLTLSLVPLACYLAFPKPPKELETVIVGFARAPYECLVERLMGKWLPISAICTAIFLAALTIVPLLGSEFVPNLSEGSVVINMRRPPSASLEEGARQTKIIERMVKEFPEVEAAYSFTGHPELATDTNKSENSDVFLARLPVATSDGKIVPLGAVVDISTSDGLAQISHREGDRVITVGMNVRGRDLGSFVAAAQAAVNKEINVPKGYRLVWGGQFDNYQSAIERLRILVPIALALIFLLLYSSFGNLRPGILIFLNVPFALVGGLVALYVRGMPLSVSAGVGFITLFGVAVLNGIVLVSTISEIEEREGLSSIEAALKGAKERLRPILTTTLVASIGFIPMAIATTAGAEVQRPLASVVISGLVTCTLFTLFAHPVLYPVVCGKPTPKQPQKSESAAQPEPAESLVIVEAIEGGSPDGQT
jgi:Cu/Ag efflux pump CusA